MVRVQKMNSTVGDSDATVIYAAGFNAHFQLTPTASAGSNDTAEDVHTFTELKTLLHLGKGYVGEGQWQPAPASNLRSAFGDHDGLIGCVDDSGALYIVPDNEGVSGLRRRHGTLVCQSTESSPPLSFIAMAGNGRIALTYKQAPNARLTHIAEFGTLEACLNYYREPSGKDNYPELHHMLPGKPRQLLANVATFAILMEGGEIYTWGDPRHQSLGRKTTGDGATPASSPGIVEALAGMTMSKIVAGGWACAALSEDGAAYLWGHGAPGTEQSLPQLKDADRGEVVLVDLPKDEGSEPLDTDDLALGDAHVAVLAEGSRLFVAGDNSNRQLGLKTSASFVDKWTEVPSAPRANRIACGPKATFVYSSRPTN